MEMLLQVLYLSLFEADGTTPVANPYGAGQATTTTSDDGKKGLVAFYRIWKPRDYVVKELTAPYGYQLSTDVIKVSASELKSCGLTSSCRQRNSGQQTIHFNSANTTNC